MKKLPKLKQFSIALGLCTMVFGLNAAKPVPPPDTNLVSHLMPVEDAKNVYSKYSQLIAQSDISGLSKGDQKALGYIVEAAKVMDRIFYKQKKANNLAIYDELTKPYYDPVYLKLFKINYSQWDTLILADNPFINTQEGSIPLGIDMYPQDMTQEEWDATVAAAEANPDQTYYNALIYDFTVIRRDSTTGKLKAIPYSEFYKSDLAEASAWLEKAENQTTDKSLKTYLKSRRAAFKSNDYKQSDKDWVNLNGDLSITIGPYEQYLDQYAGVKAAFMAHIAIVDKAETARVKYLEDKKDELIASLPYPNVCGPGGTAGQCFPSSYSSGGLESPIYTVNEVFSGGDYRATPALAFNLPNRAENRANGSKNTLIKNLTDQSFSTVGILRAKKVFTPEDVAKMDANGSFLGVVTHEVGHALTPKTMTADNADVAVELGRWYLTIEEGLADASSTYNAKILADTGGTGNPYTGLNMESFYLSFLSGYFRGNLWDLQNASSHRRGYVIALAHHLNFPDPCQSGKHAMDINSDGIVSMNVSVPKCVNPNNQDTVMHLSITELVRTYLAAEMRSNKSNDNDIEAARNLYACSKEQLWGTSYSDPVTGRTGRQAEECVGATYPGNANFKKALKIIADDTTIPVGSYKIHPQYDPPFQW